MFTHSSVKIPRPYLAEESREMMSLGPRPANCDESDFDDRDKARDFNRLKYERYEAKDRPAKQKPYIYDPVLTGQIRIFNLDTSNASDSLISGTLETHDFGDQAYVALSYAWGPTYSDGSHLTHYILCDGRRIAVTAVLHQALIRLREVARGSYKRWKFRKPPKLALWIDAICIDQGNVAERSEQVEKMHLIYDSTEVTIWLGEPSTGTLGHAETRLIKYMASKDRSSRKWIERSPEIKSASNSLVDRPWFRRRWCVQESCHGTEKKYTIMLGKATCSHLDFTKFLGGDYRARLSRWYSQFSISQRLLRNLYAFDHTECSDPRDRVYALRNLGSHTSPLRVDYSLNVRDTYLHTALAVAFRDSTDPREIRRCSSGLPRTVTFPNVNWYELLMLLSLATCKVCTAVELPDPSRPKMESWYPDWSTQSSYKSEMHESAVESIAWHNDLLYLRDAKHSLPCRMTVFPDGWCYLQVTGTLVQPFTCDPRSLDTKVFQVLPAMFQTCSIWLACVRPSSWYDQDRHALFAFVLEPGQTRSSYGCRPVFRLYSCFSLGKEHLHCGTFKDLCDSFVRMTSGELRHDVEFLLE